MVKWLFFTGCIRELLASTQEYSEQEVWWYKCSECACIRGNSFSLCAWYLGENHGPPPRGLSWLRSPLEDGVRLYILYCTSTCNPYRWVSDQLNMMNILVHTYIHKKTVSRQCRLFFVLLKRFDIFHVWTGKNGSPIFFTSRRSSMVMFENLMLLLSVAFNFFQSKIICWVSG